MPELVSSGVPAPDPHREAALAGLHDIVLPEAISRMPQTWGWAALVLAGLLGIALVAWAVHRRRRANRYRVLALAELAAIRTRARHPDTRSAALVEIPVLLKRTALAGSPRSSVAALAGEPWLAFLDAQVEGTAFGDGVGRRILEIGYLPPRRLEQIPDREVEALMALTERWIRTHRHPDADAEDRGDHARA